MQATTRQQWLADGVIAPSFANEVGRTVAVTRARQPTDTVVTPSSSTG